MKRFIRDIKKYKNYTIYAGKSELKSEVASSYLNWIWWVLEPFMFMLVYYFIATILFDNKIEYFPVFVFIGLTVWNFFNKTMLASVRLVKTNSSVVSKVYLPKYIMILQKMYVNGFKTLISFGIVVLMMIYYQVPITWNVLYVIPLLIILALFTFGFSAIVLHFGVFVDDLFNVITIMLRVVFYMSGVFYDLSDKGISPLLKSLLLKFNPTAFIMHDLRNVLLKSHAPSFNVMIFWFVMGIIVSAIGVYTIYKYENSYVKVI